MTFVGRISRRKVMRKMSDGEKVVCGFGYRVQNWLYLYARVSQVQLQAIRRNSRLSAGSDRQQRSDI